MYGYDTIYDHSQADRSVPSVNLTYKGLNSLGYYKILKRKPINCTDFSKHIANGLFPADTQRPVDVPLWSYFGRDVLDHDRTKIGCIAFLTYFGSAMSDLHLASGNKEKLP